MGIRGTKIFAALKLHYVWTETCHLALLERAARTRELLREDHVLCAVMRCVVVYVRVTEFGEA